MNDDHLTVKDFVKEVTRSNALSPKHKKAIKNICSGEEVEAVRATLNIKLRAAIASCDSPRTQRKKEVLDLLDVKSTIGDWVKDFNREVASYVGEKLPPSDIN